jgi:CDGSH-type Zn-finger protein/truncated hemoglobin YjbI
VRRCEHDDSVPRITERLSARVGDLFNVSYEILLNTFERFFAHTEESDAQLATLADATISLMAGVLDPLGKLLTSLPVGEEHPRMNAAPSFELFYEDDYLMPHRDAAWALLEERIREAADFCALIQEIATDGVKPTLAAARQTLVSVADSLAGHFGDWGAVSRFSKERPAGGEDASELLAEAGRLGAAVSASPADGDGGAHELFDDARSLLQTALRQGADERSAALAGRLVSSVLRPIAEGLTGSRPAGVDAEPLRPGGAAAADGEDLAAACARLAEAATRAYVDGGAALARPTRLMEAVAALQDLALQLAPDEGPAGREARLSAFRELLSGVAPGVRCARDGPYLVVNAERLRNWLGEEIETRPLMALCRCGESGAKPACDGACARVGFSDEKDPKRVPDRRDEYEGVQLTVFDNRGICQHSGFCTDRLNTVFHTEGAFVTPSGGRMDDIVRAVRDCPSGALSFAVDGVEARAQVDWDGTREPAIEVSKDGPYRIVGGIALTGDDGRPVPRAAGSSLEHYALCRCGHSQNKPFCSGMHWYVDFHDPLPDPNREPTLYEWCGGLPALLAMTRLFYERHVPEDPLLAPLFANMAPDHPLRVARWLGEVFGGPTLYSGTYGGYERMISQHLGKSLSEEQRARWVQLLCLSAAEAGLPNDAEFQAAFRSYLEWGSRLALENSQPGAKPPPHMPMPRWWWACEATPGTRVSALAEEPEAPEPIVLPEEGEPLGFEEHIKPLFRERDRKSMKFAFDLWSYDDVSEHGDAILERLADGSMPCDGAWQADRVAVFRRWVESGKPEKASG